MPRHPATTWGLRVLAAALWTCAIGAGDFVASAQETEIRAEAIVGPSLGVGRVQQRVTGETSLHVGDADGRVLYTAVEVQPVRRLLRELLGGVVRVNRPRLATTYFLFTGEAPLDLSIGGRPVPVRVVPGRNPESRDALLALWWRAFSRADGPWDQADGLPQLREYLAWTLGRRLELGAPRGLLIAQQPETSAWQELMVPYFGTGGERLRVQRELLASPRLESEADLPLPDAASWDADNAQQATIHPTPDERDRLARYVPEECFYLRCGTIGTISWLPQLLERVGGDLFDLAGGRGMDQELRARIERQLGLRLPEESELNPQLSRVEAAIIGTDLLLLDGPCLGLLLVDPATGAQLADTIDQQWDDALATCPAAERSRLEIAGHSVEQLATPDGRVRAYHASAGPAHLVTTSRWMAGRFFEAVAGKRALADAGDFRRVVARLSPDEREGYFAYFSQAHFRFVTSPAYRVELSRRVRSAAEIELAELALLAADAEGQHPEALAGLIEGGFLPAGFARHIDGSRLVVEPGNVRDSVRGQRSALLPIPDVAVAGVSDREAREYEQFARLLRLEWGPLEPLSFVVERKPGDAGRPERVRCRFHVDELSDTHFAWLSQWFGLPQEERLAPVEGDLASVDLVLAQERLFGGLRNVPPAGSGGRQIPGGLLRMPLWNFLMAAPHDYLVGYVGGPKNSELLALFEQRTYDAPDEDGTARSAGPLWSRDVIRLLDRVFSGGPLDVEGLLQASEQLWRREKDDMTMYSFHGQVLRDVGPQLVMEKTPRPAQLWIRAADPGNSRLGKFIDVVSYVQAQRTTLSNVRLLNALVDQWRVPPEECVALAESLLDARLRCPLGGTYEWRESPDVGPSWQATAVADADDPTELPEEYATAMLDWFRGLEGQGRFERNSLELELQFDWLPEPQPRATTTSTVSP